MKEEGKKLHATIKECTGEKEEEHANDDKGQHHG
jgi:hypothetical protein